MKSARKIDDFAPGPTHRRSEKPAEWYGNWFAKASDLFAPLTLKNFIQRIWYRCACKDQILTLTKIGRSRVKILSRCDFMRAFSLRKKKLPLIVGTKPLPSIGSHQYLL